MTSHCPIFGLFLSYQLQKTTPKIEILWPFQNVSTLMKYNFKLNFLVLKKYDDVTKLHLPPFSNFKSSFETNLVSSFVE